MERSARCCAGVFTLAIVMTGLMFDASPSSAQDCTCRNRDGKKYELGRVICLEVDGRRYLARCEMNLNVTTWTKLQEGCPVSGGNAPGSSLIALSSPGTVKIRPSDFRLGPKVDKPQEY